MKTRICYNINYLLKMLPNYELSLIDIISETEDTISMGKRYFFTLEEVSSVHYYHSLGTSATIHMKNGQIHSALGDNVFTKDESVLALNNNELISPSLTVSGEWLESTEILVKWLINRGIDHNALHSIMKEFTVYSTIEYPGVPTPSRVYKYWSYSSENLVLDEREIEQVLNGIEDKILRKKIELILYARVFKRRN